MIYLHKRNIIKFIFTNQYIINIKTTQKNVIKIKQK